MSSSHSHASTSTPSKKARISHDVTPELVARSNTANVVDSNISNELNKKTDAADKPKSPPVEFYDFSNEDNEKIGQLMDHVDTIGPKTGSVTVQPVMYDPRGISKLELLPNTFCVHCRCPSRYCHDKQYGQYLECQVVNEVALSAVPLREHQVDAIYRRHYTALLRFRIFEMEGVLDMAVYEIPFCIINQTFQSSLRYLRHRSYHNYMRSCIVNGRGGLRNVNEQVENDENTV
jgi:hypothetical protein